MYKLMRKVVVPLLVAAVASSIAAAAALPEPARPTMAPAIHVLPPAPNLTEAEATSLIEAAYNKLVYYSGDSLPGLKFEISNVRVVGPEDFFKVPARDAMTYETGLLLQGDPTTFHDTVSGLRGQYIPLKWVQASDTQESNSRKLAENSDRLTLGDLLALGGDNPAFARVDAVVLFHVRASSNLVEKEYDTCFTWATNSTGEQHVYPQDVVTQAVAMAIMADAPRAESLEKVQAWGRKVIRGSSTNPPSGTTDNASRR